MKYQLEWVNIEYILPNPRNPRKNPGYKSHDMQKILSQKGFEEAIVAYKGNGEYFYIISGHRRWFSSKKMGLSQIPVYIVEAPKSQLEELERLGSIQSNQSDWTEYEWMVHTVNLQKYNPEISYEDLAAMTSQSISTVKKRILVTNFYDSVEIATQLNNKTYSLNMLDTIRLWIERVNKYHTRVMENLGKVYIRQCMLKKLDNKLLNSQILKGDYLEKANTQQIIDFITDPTKAFDDFKNEIEISKLSSSVTSLSYNVKVLKQAKKDIEVISFKRKEEALELYKNLTLLETKIEQIINKIDSDI